ncbi:MAG: aspartate/glutamate racemase family protein [Bacillota bacterium]
MSRGEEGARRLRRVLVINPVLQSPWDDMDKECLDTVAPGGFSFDVEGLPEGPAAIMSAADARLAEPAVLSLLLKRRWDYDAFLINCFGDPALRPSREVTERPVLGAGESGLACASGFGRRFAVASVSDRALRMSVEYARELGLHGRLAGAFTVGMSVPDLLDAAPRVPEALVGAVVTGAREHGVDTVLLGCTGMASMAPEIARRTGLFIIEPLRAALGLVVALLTMGLSHSRAGLYMAADTSKVAGYDLGGGCA